MTILRAVGRHLAGNVVAYLALFMAMGGTAYAVDEWTGANIVDGSLKGADIDESTLSRVPDANLLDGVDSTKFARGRILSGSLTIPVNSSGQLFVGNDIFNLRLICTRQFGATINQVQFFNNTPTQTNMFSDNGGSNPVHRTLAANGTLGDSYLQNASTTGDLFTFQTQSALGRMATVWVAVRDNTSSTCHIQAQAITN